MSPELSWPRANGKNLLHYKWSLREYHHVPTEHNATTHPNWIESPLLRTIHQRRWTSVWARSVVVILLLASAPRIQAQSGTAEGLTAKLDARTGDYVVSGRVSGWQFRGSTDSPVRDLVRAAGGDALGPFHSLRFNWSWNGVTVTGEIKTYDQRPVARFQLTYDTRPAPHPQLNFPNFTSLPGGLHVFSYRDLMFAPPQFAAGNYGTPWLLFDDHFNAAILSPAGGYQVTGLSGNGKNTAGVSLDAEVDLVPAGYSVSSILVLGAGIGRVYDDWGAALNIIQGRSRPSNEADDSLRYLGYWTDGGAYYYRNFDPQLGYDGTLLAEIRHLHSSGIPVRYLQLDSWWYEKGNVGPDGIPLKPQGPGAGPTVPGPTQRGRPVFPAARWNAGGGIWLYEASPTLFPQGLEAFHQQVEMPLVTHSKYIGPDSPYHGTYLISGIAPIDSKYWSHIASYLHESGVVNYEQDWLDYIQEYSGFEANLSLGDQFFDNMASAMKAQGLTMQYSMAKPRNFLQGSRYSNLTTIRVSGDRFIRTRWHEFLFTSQLAGALGIWPWADNANSQDVNAILLQTLSAGPVGFGDELGKESKQNLLQAARTDGVIVKPDAPLVPIDAAYLDGALGRHKPTLGYTHTEHAGITTAYLFAFAAKPEDHGPVQFQAHDVGLSGAMVVYDYFAHRFTLVPAGDSFHGELGGDHASFYICATPGKSGIAFLGDRDKFVGTGRMRIASIADSAKQLETDVIFARDESELTLHVHAGFEPRVTAQGGRVGIVKYDPATGEFDVPISPDPKKQPVTRSAWEPSVREVHVTFSRP